jgi:DNA-binding Lrp family transcriptional regulator
MKTAIWTDVKEMNENLAIIDENRSTPQPSKDKTETKTPPPTIKIDGIDEKIAEKLAKNGRISWEALSKEVGITPDIAKKKYDRLKESGVLKVTIQIDLLKLGYRAMGIFFTVTSNQQSKAIIDKLIELPDVISIMKTAGNYDLQIYSLVQNLDQLMLLQESIGKIPGISKIDLEIIRLKQTLNGWPSPKQYISTF